MRLNHWLRSLFEVPPRRRIRTAASVVEALEDRTLLSTFTVNTTADTMDANRLAGDDTINLPAGTSTRTCMAVS